MNLSLFFKIFLISLFSISKSSPNDDKLIFVMTHFRHGARAPLKIDNKNQDLLGILDKSRRINGYWSKNALFIRS